MVATRRCVLLQDDPSGSYALAADLAVAQGDIVALESDVADHESRITTLEGAGTTYPAVVRDIDYTAEANNTAPGDGAITLGTVPHTIQNSAAASQFDIVNGVGIRIRYQTAGSAVSFGSGNTGPGIWAHLRDVIPSHAETHRYLFMWHIDVREGTITFNNAADLVCFYLQKLANLSSEDAYYEEQAGGYDAAGATRLYSGSATNAIGWGATEQATTQRVRTEMDTDNADNDPADTVIAVMQIDPSRLAVYAGHYNAGWPAIEDLRLVGMVHTDIVGDAGPYNLGLTRLLVGLSGTTGSASPHGVDVHRLRIYDLGV